MPEVNKVNNIYILQNELTNMLDTIGNRVNATDDEKVIALQLVLATACKTKITRMAYISKEMEEKADGNSDEKR